MSRILGPRKWLDRRKIVGLLTIGTIAGGAVVIGCQSAAPTVPVADEAVIPQAYASYAALVDKSITFSADVKLIDSQPIRTDSDRALIYKWSQSVSHFPHLVPFDEVNGLLHPKFQFWGQNGYTPLSPVFNPSSTEDTAEYCTPDGGADNPGEDSEGSDLEPESLGDGTAPIVAPADGFDAKRLPTAMRRWKVTITINGDTFEHEAVSLHYADQHPLILDTVLMLVNEYLGAGNASGGVQREADGEDIRAPNTAANQFGPADGCNDWSAGWWYKRWRNMYCANCFGYNRTDYPQADWARVDITSAQVDCRRQANGGCRVATCSGTATPTGAGWGGCTFGNGRTYNPTADSQTKAIDPANSEWCDYAVGGKSSITNNATTTVSANVTGMAGGLGGGLTLGFTDAGGTIYSVTESINTYVNCKTLNGGI